MEKTEKTDIINNDELTEDLGELIKVRQEKLKSLIETGKNPYEITLFDKTHSSKDILTNAEALFDKPVKIAGRIMSKRVMGKASFAHVLDGDGQLQIYLKADVLADKYEDFKKYDIGDIVGVSGTVFTTHKGEISVAVTDIVLLSKSLLPLPEKWHGLKDNDLRYRQRYVDLIANPSVKETFVKRSKIISAVRSYLDSHGFLEVETPILATLAGGASARP
jgi:lysyl-tRNA synthetase class 2